MKGSKAKSSRVAPKQKSKKLRDSYKKVPKRLRKTRGF